MDNENIAEIEVTQHYKDHIRESTFLGTTPFDTILESIKEQFDDYINLKDKTNYVELFYTQWQKSWDLVYYDTYEDHPVEKKEILNEIYATFIETITKLFDERLALSLNDSFIQIESEQSQEIITAVYEFFILKAKRNFTNVFARSILEFIGPGVPAESDEFYEKAQERLKQLEGIVTDIHTRDFLEWAGDQHNILPLFTDEHVLGNFLRRYSAKLYQNEEFVIEIIAYVTMYVSSKEDMAAIWNE